MGVNSLPKTVTRPRRDCDCLRRCELRCPSARSVCRLHLLNAVRRRKKNLPSYRPAPLCFEQQLSSVDALFDQTFGIVSPCQYKTYWLTRCLPTCRKDAPFIQFITRIYGWTFVPELATDRVHPRIGSRRVGSLKQRKSAGRVGSCRSKSKNLRTITTTTSLMYTVVSAL